MMQVSRLVMVFLKWVKNASQTDRENVIGALEGKEVCREECSLAGVQMRVAGGESIGPFDQA